MTIHVIYIYIKTTTMKGQRFILVKPDSLKVRAKEKDTRSIMKRRRLKREKLC